MPRVRTRNSTNKPTMRDVAVAAGFDMATVSRVLGGKSYVSDTARESVMAAVKRLGYHQNELARMVATGRSRMIGLISPGGSDKQRGGFVVGPLYGIIDEASKHQYTVKVYCISDEASAQAAIDSASQLRLSGLVVIQPEFDKTDWLFQRIRESDQTTPFVLVDTTSELAQYYDRVNCDDAAGVEAVVDHLVSLGHRRIACVSGPLDISSFARRQAAFRAAMIKHGLAVVEENIIDAGRPMVTDGMERLLKRLDQFTAVACLSDARAMALLQAAYKLNIRVPDELSVTSIGDWVLETYAAPALTTASMPFGEMGRVALDLLISRIEESQSEKTADTRLPKEHRLPVKLIIRESTSTPRK